MEKSPLPTDNAPGLPEGLVVGKANQERRQRLRRGFQVLFLLISCFAVASIGFNTIRDIAHPHPHHRFGGEGEGRGPHSWFGGGEPPHKGDGPPPHPKPIACYPLAPGETVNVTLNLRPGGPPPFHHHGKDHHDKEDKPAFSLFGKKKEDSKHPKHPKHFKHGKGPAPPHIFLHPSLFSSDVALLRDGEADKTKLGKAPGGPEGIEVYAIFSRDEASETTEDDGAEVESKKADICVHRAPNGVSIGAFRPPPHHGKNATDSHPRPPPPHKGEKKGDRPFPPHPEDQYADISAKIHVPAGLGLHLDSLPPPPPFPRH